ncbi:MAG: chorismate mutase [Clostridia bacterium]|nr:chorismate mutase [Clostridia bacterium]
MELSELRTQMDETDGKLLEMFVRRMELSSQIAQYKKDKKLPVQDLRREREKLVSVAQAVPTELRDYASGLYSMLFEISRSYQNRLIGTYSELSDRVWEALQKTPNIFPDYEAVACQGIEGANSHSACLKLFPHANAMFFSSFEAVFTAIEKGLCRYGIVPVENSTVGSVTQVCDLMMSHRFSIVRSVRLRVSHDLLAKPGTKLEDIKEIYSHQQAISQCSRFLSELKNVRVIPCENTAVAARLAATSEEKGVAAIASPECLRYYPLSCVKAGVQNTNDNYTRFICISRELEIYPGADRTSLMLTLPHEPGALCRLLNGIYALDINLVKLESRPLPGHSFEFMFYFDLEVPVYSQKLTQLLSELPGACDSFTYLGSYSEVPG